MKWFKVQHGRCPRTQCSGNLSDRGNDLIRCTGCDFKIRKNEYGRVVIALEKGRGELAKIGYTGCDGWDHPDTESCQKCTSSNSI